MYDPRIHRFANNAAAKLATDINDVQTSIQITSGLGARFPTIAPGEIFKLTIEDYVTGKREICHCTAKSGDTFTIERGKEDTVAQVFSVGALVQHRITAGTLEWLQSLFDG